MSDVFAVGTSDGPVYADSHLVVMRTEDPSGLRLAGEIDISNSEAVSQAMRIALSESLRPHIDLRALSFSDVSGIRAIVEIAQEREDGHQVLLHGLPRHLQTVMRATGWYDLPSLALCDCGGQSG